VLRCPSAGNPAGAAVESKAGAKGLRRGAIGLTSGVVIGLASAAPAYSLAASLGVLVVLVGEKAPAVMLVAFVPMVLIAVAYKELNKAEPDCGTTFTWAGRAFGPWVGWMGGWTAILACIICLASLAQIAGAYTFYVLGLDELGDSSLWSTAIGVVWIMLMTWLSYRGVEVSARLQAALLSVELVLLAILTQLALVKVLSGDAIGRAADPQLSWLWPGGLGVTQLADAVLIAGPAPRACVLSIIDYAVPAEDETAVFGIGRTFVVGIGTLLLGGVIMILYSWLAPWFFRGASLSRQAADSDALPRHGVAEKAGTTTPTTAFDDAPAVNRAPSYDGGTMFDAVPNGRPATEDEPITMAHPLTARTPGRGEPPHGTATGATEGRDAGPPERSGPLGRGAARRGTVRQEPLTVLPRG
jgi:hypothetical protein